MAEDLEKEKVIAFATRDELLQFETKEELEAGKSLWSLLLLSELEMWLQVLEPFDAKRVAEIRESLNDPVGILVSAFSLD